MDTTTQHDKIDIITFFILLIRLGRLLRSLIFSVSFFCMQPPIIYIYYFILDILLYIVSYFLILQSKKKKFFRLFIFTEKPLKSLQYNNFKGLYLTRNSIKNYLYILISYLPSEQLLLLRSHQLSFPYLRQLRNELRS